MTDQHDLIIPAGESGHGRYTVDVTPERAGWTYSGIKVLRLAAGETEEVVTGEDELIVLPLSGGCTVVAEGRTYELVGRPDVFTAVTDYLYIPRDTAFTISSAGGARVAFPTARAGRRLRVSYQGVDKVRTELRGAGQASRQVNNYAVDNELQTDRLLAVEVLTPGGNWSSYPPHKHDEHTEEERELEEIYLFDVRPGPDGGGGFGFHRTYGTPDRPIEIATEVRAGDLVLTPHGYHGPSMAAPGYDLYYLNVMAGPAEDRRWMMTDDPAHTWIRGTWESHEVDPRLPMTRPVESTEDRG